MENPTRQFKHLTQIAKTHHSALVHHQNQAGFNWIGYQGNHLYLQNLFKRLLNEVKHAGKVYAAARLWQLIYWQPIYLSVLACELWQNPIALKHLKLRIHKNSITGYHFTQIEYPQGVGLEPVQQACQEINIYCSARYTELKAVAKLSKRTAFGLLVDCVLNVLISLCKQQENDAKILIQRAQPWLEALGYPHSDLLSIYDTPQQVIKKRIACCYYYMVDADNVCQDCPRQSKHGQIQIIDLSLN